MRVMRGYQHDDKLVVDGKCYPARALADAAYQECVNAGGHAFDMPPFFCTGSIYADAIHALAARWCIKSTEPPADMDSSFLPLFNGWTPASRRPLWPQIFIT